MVSAYHNPHCARVQPARLVRGLADVVERLGVDIYETTPVTEIRAGRVVTALGTVSAPVVLRATEGFTASLPGLRRRWLPMNSSMIATEPIPQDIWESIGWEGRETLGDTAHGFFYAQRTVDDRIAIGGRSVPYRFGSRTDVDGQVPERTITHLTAVLHSVLPQTRDIPDRPCMVRRACRTPGLGGVRNLRQGNGFGLPQGDTSDMASPPPTWPGAPWPTWCSASRRRSRSCHGSGTGHATGNPSRCGGWACAGCISPTRPPTGTSRAAARTTSPIAVVADRIAGRP